MKFFLLLLLIFTSVLEAQTFSVMTFNVENLFDNQDDVGKDDKAYLPASLKTNIDHQKSCMKIRSTTYKNECLFMNWSVEHKQRKIKNIKDFFAAMESTPDVVALQEVENELVLKSLFESLEEFGYNNYALLEGKDYRGIDNAIISKFPIYGVKNFEIDFQTSKSTRDTRPILEVKLAISDSIIRFYVVHFPSPSLSVDMRYDAFNTLNKLASTHNDPVIALGDFNVTSKEEKDEKIFEKLSSYWSISHLEGCKGCRGTYFYSRDNTWSFLDAIMIAKKRNLSFSNIRLIQNAINSDVKSGKPIGYGFATQKGISDHLPIFAEVKIN